MKMDILKFIFSDVLGIKCFVFYRVVEVVFSIYYVKNKYLLMEKEGRKECLFVFYYCRINYNRF